MKKITVLLAIIALLTFTACGDYSSTTDSNDVTDSHDVATTTNTTSDTNSTVEGTIIDSNNTLEVPTFAGNSQGKLVIQCEDDIVYYIMAYDCLKEDTKPSVTATGGDLTVDEELVHVGEVFYTKGHVERTDGNSSVTVTGRVFSGGVTLPTTWVKTCE